VGDDVDGEGAALDLRKYVGGVAFYTDRQGAPGLARVLRAIERLMQRRSTFVQVPGLEAPVDPIRIDLDAHGDAVVHRYRERLRASHPTETGRQYHPAAQRTPASLARERAERFVSPLNVPLRADVDTRARRY